MTGLTWQVVICVSAWSFQGLLISFIRKGLDGLNVQSTKQGLSGVPSECSVISPLVGWNSTLSWPHSSFPTLCSLQFSMVSWWLPFRPASLESYLTHMNLVTRNPQHTFLEPFLLSSGTRSCCLRVQLSQPLWGVIPFFIAQVTVPPDLPFLWHGQVNSRKLEWLHSACNLFSFSQDQSPLLPVVQYLKRAVLCILATVLLIQARKTSLQSVMSGVSKLWFSSQIYLSSSQSFTEHCFASSLMECLQLFPAHQQASAATSKNVRSTKP